MCKNPYWWAPGMDALGSQLRGWFYHPCTAVFCMSCSTHVHSASQPCYQLPCRLCQLFKFLQGNYFLTFNLQSWTKVLVTVMQHLWYYYLEFLSALINGATFLKISGSSSHPTQCWNSAKIWDTHFQSCLWCVGKVRACVVLKKLHKCKFVSRLLSMIIARDGAKLLAYCLDYNRETYFFYLVPTNRSLLLFILIMTLWIIVFSRMGMILEKLILTWSMSKLRYVINKAGFMVRYGSGQYS